MRPDQTLPSDPETDPDTSHGGDLDVAIARFGGTRDDWLDLSTGINPVPYPVDGISARAWRALPDAAAIAGLEDAARRFWQVPEGAEVIAAPGASAIIARLPEVLAGAMPPGGSVHIRQPTYNEWGRAFAGATAERRARTAVEVYVHPNNPDGRLIPTEAVGRSAITLIDESFCDPRPDLSQVSAVLRDGVMVVKSFGKFWGLAGMRLGFLIARPEAMGQAAQVVRLDGVRGKDLRQLLGPWPVSGPAVEIGTRALGDAKWAEDTRVRLRDDCRRLDDLVIAATDASLVGGTPLFRTYKVADAETLRDRLARHRIWVRIFPYSETWVRFGLPGTAADWARLTAALA